MLRRKRIESRSKGCSLGGGWLILASSRRLANNLTVNDIKTWEDMPFSISIYFRMQKTINVCVLSTIDKQLNEIDM